ncbi:MAG: cadherin-like domain-containing protein, partial [Saprospiraceae bacterium]|nr:cadherin-like domain-containing protein [Saprospiraceae bacterium]
MKHILLSGVLLLSLCGQLSAQTVPTPTQTDEIIIDNGAAGKADPADRIRYKVTIQNTGAADANGVQLNVVPDPRTTFVPGTFRSSPLALPDAYASTGNVGIIVPAASGLKANDFDDNIAGATVTAGTFASTQGGSVTISSDGGFTYTPPPGFTGSDMFNYTLVDGNPVGLPVPTSDVGTATITVSNL